MATHFKGPVISQNGFEGALTGNVTGNVTGNIAGAVAATTLSASTSLAVGASPASIKKIGSGTIALNPGALAAGDEIDLSAAITGIAVGDILVLMPPAAAVETGLAVAAVWITAGNANVRISNLNAAAALTGGANNWTYLWVDLT